MSEGRTSRAMLRQGFTLVEMLVATALIIFVMLILTTVFTAGLQALRNMRGVGSMQDSLRQAATIIRRDLATPHFAEHTTATAGPALSQQRLDLYDWTPPREGFFRIWQGSTSYDEGYDGDLKSFRMDPYPSVINKVVPPPPAATPPTPLLSYLHFTVRNELRMGEGAGRDRYVANVSLIPFLDSLEASGLLGWPPGQLDAEKQKYRSASRPEYLSSDGMLYSSWAEVAYFLQPVLQVANGNISHSTVGSTGAPLYTLYRRRKFLFDSRPPNVFTPIPDKAPAPNDAASMIPDMSYYRNVSDAMNPTVCLNTPSDVTIPEQRFPVDPNNLNTFAQLPPTPMGGDDVLMENVISFEIRANWDVPRDFRFDRRNEGVRPPRPFDGAPGNPATPPGGNGKSVDVNNPENPDFPFLEGGATQNPDYPFDDLPATPAFHGNRAFVPKTILNAGGKWPPAGYLDGTPAPRVFDTWSNQRAQWAVPQRDYSNSLRRYETGTAASGQQTDTEIPLRIRIKALQLRIRVWDTRTQQTRQITIIQDM